MVQLRQLIGRSNFQLVARHWNQEEKRLNTLTGLSEEKIDMKNQKSKEVTARKHLSQGEEKDLSGPKRFNQVCRRQQAGRRSRSRRGMDPGACVDRHRCTDRWDHRGGGSAKRCENAAGLVRFVG